jgi:hypothetical protein
LRPLASEFRVHPVEITAWKQQVLTGLPSSLFAGAASQQRQADEALLAPLYQAIGPRKVAREGLRKKGQIRAERRGPGSIRPMQRSV